ncbi:hypothetical protein SteCoe_8489 [Stentor coeruleus]|uniref:Uncharacterized protein n=1 Tax=Stentor coeruleus TaxID=5963 RepID=A0A1R2CK58_9CILI|nr:hypothetical protein SteCoe_8489 [Stentor coeruleus]
MYSYTAQNERVYQLSGKLSSILSTLESDKDFYVEQVEKRIMVLESNIYESIEQENKKFRVVIEKLQSINDRLEEMKNLRDEFFKAKTEEINEFEAAIIEELSHTDFRKKDSESKFYRIIDDRLGSLSSELSREIKSRKDNFDELNEYCSTNLNKVKDTLKNELVEREENAEKFSNNISSRINAVKQLISVEKEARDKAEEALLAMLQDLVARMKKEIEDERNEREESEETLLGLLEETCSKLNNITKFKD